MTVEFLEVEEIEAIDVDPLLLLEYWEDMEDEQ